jgi:hypothetical protein
VQLDNNADDVMRLIGETIRSVRPSPTRPWHKRIVLGCWAAKYVPLCSHYLPGYSVTHIGFSTLVAEYFFTVPNISFNMQQNILMAPWGRRFIRRAQRQQRAVYAWTVNEEGRMRWDIRQGLDGVITDDPKLFLEVRNAWHEGTKDGLRIRDAFEVARINVMALLYTVMFWYMFGRNETGPRRSR